MMVTSRRSWGIGVDPATGNDYSAWIVYSTDGDTLRVEQVGFVPRGHDCKLLKDEPLTIDITAEVVQDNRDVRLLRSGVQDE